MARVAIWLVLSFASTAAADGGRVSGFVTYGVGELRGRVTGQDGKPIGGERVHVVSNTRAEQIVTTDSDGRFRAELRGGISTMVYVEAEAHIAGQVTLPAAAGSSVVEIHEAIPPAELAIPLDPTIVPEYSATAIDNDTWTRAWMLLDVDQTGSVVRLKMLRRPGFDLDAIATQAALKLKFEPARDQAGAPIRTLVIWSFEWPSFWWLKNRHSSVTRLPDDVTRVPCRGVYPTRTQSRDCSEPDMAMALREPWLTR
jgi:hypothetical protein